MEKVKYRIHHQAVGFCPECEEMFVEDLGEDDLADGIQIKCDCGCKFELEGNYEDS